MIAACFYIVSFLGAVSTLVLLPKSEEKRNLLTGVLVSYVSVLSIGALCAFLLSTVGIPVQLWSMGSIYSAILAGGLFIQIRKRKIQKYYLRKADLVMIGICVVIVGGVALYIFTPSLRMGYSNPIDPVNHYLFAMRVVRGEKVSGMFFAALYNGMFIRLFQWLFPVNWTYKAFILADIYHTIIEFLFFYAVAVVLTEKREKRYIPIIASVLYWCGFPLFSFAKGGYVYWSMVIMLIEYVMLLLKWYVERVRQRKQLLLMIGMGCFAVAVCYIQLAPGIFLSVFGVILYESYLEKKLCMNRKNVCIMLVGAGLTLVCAVVGYYLVFVSQNIRIFEAFKIGSMESPGFDLLLFSPIVVWILLEVYHSGKRFNVFHIGMFCYAGIQLVMTFLSALGFISTYYLFKGYIVLWFLVFAVFLTKEYAFDAVQKHRLGLYGLGVCCWIMFSYNGADTKQFGIQSSVYIQNLAHLIQTDFGEGYLSNGEKNNLFRYAVEEIDDEFPIPAVMTNERKGAGALYRAIYEEGSSMVRAEWSEQELEEELNKVNAQYFIVFFDDVLYREQLREYLDSFERVYQNEDGFIAKRY